MVKTIAGEFPFDPVLKQVIHLIEDYMSNEILQGNAKIETGLEMFGGKHAPWFKIGNQKFHLWGANEKSDAETILKRLKEAFGLNEFPDGHCKDRQAVEAGVMCGFRREGEYCHVCENPDGSPTLNVTPS